MKIDELLFLLILLNWKFLKDFSTILKKQKIVLNFIKCWNCICKLLLRNFRKYFLFARRYLYIEKYSSSKFEKFNLIFVTSPPETVPLLRVVNLYLEKIFQIKIQLRTKM